MNASIVHDNSTNKMQTTWVIVFAVVTFIFAQAFEPIPTPYPSTWEDVASWPDPIAPYLKRFREQLKTAAPIKPTGLRRADYLKVVTGVVDFFCQHQNSSGAIIDPYKKVEWQYSTPAFAHAAALLVDQAGRKDLIKRASLALDWATLTLSERRAASHHEDFFAPLTAHAIPILKPYVSSTVSAKWEQNIRNFDPYKTYRSHPGNNNWNIVAMSGEMWYYVLGLRNNTNYVEDSLAAQGHLFTSHFGMYLEGPMAYDHFPRIWAASIIEIYSGKYLPQLQEVLRRASITSLFLQSPCGELPVGGRSAHHQWNEAEQIVTYEIYAARAMAAGDLQLAAIFKRAAHLALSSMLRWIRKTGELWIVKNFVDPALEHGFESYSSNSQYNLLPMAMLSLAYNHADVTEGLQEIAAPADLGGYVIQTDLHKVIANAGGMYIEIDTDGDPHYDATGFIRIHKKDFNPQLGPSDSLSAHAVYIKPKGQNTTTGIGAAWLGSDKQWHRVGEMINTTGVTVSDISETPDQVSFTLEYGGPQHIIEHYVITPIIVILTTDVVGNNGPLRYTWPILADNGQQTTDIKVVNGVVYATLDGMTQTYSPIGATSIYVEDTLYANRNGWARVAVAEYPNGGKITLVISPKVGQ